MAMSRTAKLLDLLTVAGVAASAIVLAEGFQSSGQAGVALPAVVLPVGCVRPADGFLIVASQYGYNDSVLEGAGPSKLWPVINVTLGQSVTIIVCNVDSIQSHGFEIGDYFDKQIESVAPGQVLTVTFVANKAGDFPIYCAIFCTIHLFMEYGMLRVLS